MSSMTKAEHEAEAIRWGMDPVEARRKSRDELREYNKGKRQASPIPSPMPTPRQEQMKGPPHPFLDKGARVFVGRPFPGANVETLHACKIIDVDGFGNCQFG